MSEICLGINNCFAVKRWPEPERWCEHVREKMCLDHVQFSFDLLDPYTDVFRRRRVVKRITNALRVNGLQLTSTFTGLAAYSWSMFGHPDADLRAEAKSWWHRAIDLTAELGAPKTGGHLGAMSFTVYSSPVKKKESLARIIEAVGEITYYAKKRGLNAILWEAMTTPRESPHSVPEAKEVLGLVNRESAVPVELCLDLGHTCGYDLTAEEKVISFWLDELLPLTTVIHLQQSDGKFDHHWPFTRQFNELGIVEPKKVVERVKGVSTPAKIEMDFEIIHPFETKSEQVLADTIESIQLWKSLI